MLAWAEYDGSHTLSSEESAEEKSSNLIRLLSRGWIALLGVLSFLINFVVLFLFCVYLEAILGHNFLFSILFFVILKYCLEYEKLFWVWKIALSSLFDYFSNALTLFLYRGNYKLYIIQLNVILIVVLKKSRCFFISFRGMIYIKIL